MSDDLSRYEELLAKEAKATAAVAAAKVALLDQEKVFEKIRSERLQIRDRLQRSIAGNPDGAAPTQAPTPAPSAAAKAADESSLIAPRVRALFQDRIEPISIPELCAFLGVAPDNKTVRSALHRLLHEEKTIKRVKHGVYRSSREGEAAM
jgi:hypothetical protein